MRILALGSIVFVGALAAISCTSGDSTPHPDANNGSGSGSGSAFGATCSAVSDASTECASGVCTDSFDQLGVICSVKCDSAGTGAECPTGSMGMKCNMKGYCRP